MARCVLLWTAGSLLLFSTASSAQPANRQVLHGHRPAVVTGMTSNGRLEGTKRIRLAIGLPSRDPTGLSQLIKDLGDPTSPKYRQYLTPGEFTEQFGPSEQDYQSLIQFAQANGLTVKARHPNRVILDVEGAVSDIEKTFHVTMRTYQHPTEGRNFFAPDVDPAVDAPVHITAVGGLDNYSKPHPHLKKKAAGGIQKAGTGSGPQGAFGGNDFRAAYVPGTSLTGTGQSVGLLEFDAYYAADIASYRSKFSIPSVPLINVPVDGGISTPGDSNSEVALDIEMTIAMAPGLSAVYVYECPFDDAGGNPLFVDAISRMANDNLSRQLSCSWGDDEPDAATAEVIFQQMAAQGQTFFDASGDTDAFGTSQRNMPEFPSESPSIVQVGGTTLTTASAGGAYSSETVWNAGHGEGSTGGVATHYTIPSYQVGISMATNQGSTTMRNVPDVALVADNIWVYYDNGSSDVFFGTSCAAPLWAGLTALINQKAAANGMPPVGFLNPAVYNIGKGATYAANFHDVTSGNNFNPNSPSKYSAVTGFDLCTGWGTPQGTALIASLGGPFVPTITGFTPANGPVGGSVTITGTNFFGVSKVTFNGVTASFTANSSTQITATVPTGVSNGTIAVTTPGGVATSSGSFVMFGFSPTMAVQGASVTLSGSGFTGATAVKFNGTTAAFVVNSGTQITATVPAGATSGPISVTAPGGTTTSSSSFIVLTGTGAPTITNFSPGSAAVGASVTLTGTNFVNVTGVTFNGVAAVFTVNSQTQITATVPSPSGSLTGFIAVTTSLGTGTSATAFTTSPTVAIYNSATDVPLTVPSFTATGTTVNFTLNFAPATGTNLTVINNTGLGFIQGTFGNLAQGQLVTLTFNGVTYSFVANYFGGTGNDLVLQWAGNRLVTWGYNLSGQLGNNSTSISAVPVSVTSTGVLSGKTVIAMAAGAEHTLALCSDGTLAAWGSNASGQLGNNSTTDSHVPVAVNALSGSALFGKTAIAVSAGDSHSLALCSDGTVVAWGQGIVGQLGNGGTANLLIPGAVSTSAGSALFGKTVVAISAGIDHSLALCSDGTVVSWGYNLQGELGNNGTTNSLIPVAVDVDGGDGSILQGKTVITISAGFQHSVAVCSDGTVAAWGADDHGQLGDNNFDSALYSHVPIPVYNLGVLSGKTVIAGCAGYQHGMALNSDGTVATWGDSTYGQLGNGATTSSLVPVSVITSGVLSGKKVVAVSSENYACLALCSDNTAVSWGAGISGELGNGGASNSSTPVAISTSGLATGERFVKLVSGSSAYHGLGLVATPLKFPTVTTTAATSITGTSATLNATANPNGTNGTVTFQYGPTISYGSTTAGVSVGSGTSTVNASTAITGLSGHKLYHFIAQITNGAGSASGTDLTFTTLNNNPVANADTATLTGSSVIISVLSNDTDPDGDTLTVTGVTQGSLGTVTFNSSSVTYTPGASFATSDNFTYTINDGFGGTAIGTVTVNTPLQNWRTQTFGANAGNPAIAGDNADPNHNGIPNLLEYALHGDPLGNSTGLGILPAPVVGPTGRLQITFTRYQDRSDVTLIVQANDALTGTWTNLAQSVNGGPFTIITSGATVQETGSGNAITVTVGDLYLVTDPAHPHRFMRLSATGQ